MCGRHGSANGGEYEDRNRKVSDRVGKEKKFRTDFGIEVEAVEL
jgi:hypothetical protein